MKIVAKPIDAIVIFIDREMPSPSRFKYKDEDGNSKLINIDKILSVSETEIPGNKFLVFECQSTIGMNDIRYQIRYCLDTYRWILYKI